MARGYGTGIEHLVGDGVVSGPPFTFGCWARTTSISANQVILQIGNGTSIFNTWYMTFAGASGGDPISLVCRAASGSPAVVNTTTGFSASTWHHVCAVITGAADRDIYIDGGSSANSSTSVTVATPVDMILGRAFSASGSLFGDLAEVFVYDAALSTDQITMLAAGVTPKSVSPADLIFYAPLIRGTSGGDEFDIVGGNTLTETGTSTVVEHPRVYSPRQRSVYIPAAAGGGGRIMSSLTGSGGLAFLGGLAGSGGGLAG